MSKNAGRIAPALEVFCKAAREGLDGYVVANRDSGLADIPKLSVWFRRFLLALVRRDPCPNDTFTSGPIDRRRWQFSFHSVRLFVSVFSSRYPANHPRHTTGGTFVLFQPEDSFTSHHIGSQFPNASPTKEAIRKRFASAGMLYPAGLIDQRIEALLYILPVSEDDPPIRWWD